MNMKKIMAAGIAATMAVTSLAAVASAAEQTFPMAQTIGTSEVKDVLTYYFTDNVTTAISGAEVKNAVMSIALKSGAAWDYLTGVKMEVTGLRTNATTPITESYQFANNNGTYTLALKDNYVNQAGEANLTSFDRITGVKIYISVKKEHIDNVTDYEGTYNAINGNGQSLVDFTMVDDSNLGTAGTDNATFKTAIEDSNPSGWYGAEKSTADLYHFIPVTTTNTTILRNDVKKLSKTSHYNSTGLGQGGQDADDQSMNGEGLGTKPNGFIGLAGQVAKFFNKQTNGDIVFKFAPAAASNGTQWNNGGIPSTEVGLVGSSMSSTAFALFVNYETSTGSLVSIGEVDADALTVTFPMDEILDALNGYTIGTVQDIYYGMNKGINYGAIDTVNFGKLNAQNCVGYLVESVTLTYDEDASDEDIVDGDEDEGDEGDVDVDVDGDEDEGDEGDVDVDVDGDEDEGDGEVDGDTDEDENLPTDEDEAGEDENPGTGVALAVVPAIMAAAAVVVSKKRK